MQRKCFFIILLIIPFLCDAQDTVKKSISLFKASPKIDSLITLIINIPQNLNESKKDSCLLLGLFKTKDDAGFVRSLHTLNRNQTIFDFENFTKNKNCGYFELNGYLIFVYGDDFIKKFFIPANSEKEFTFIKPSPKELLFEATHLMSWTVFYKGEVFSWGVH